MYPFVAKEITNPGGLTEKDLTNLLLLKNETPFERHIRRYGTYSFKKYQAIAKGKFDVAYRLTRDWEKGEIATATKEAVAVARALPEALRPSIDDIFGQAQKRIRAAFEKA